MKPSKTACFELSKSDLEMAQTSGHCSKSNRPAQNLSRLGGKEEHRTKFKLIGNMLFQTNFFFLEVLGEQDQGDLCQSPEF